MPLLNSTPRLAHSESAVRTIMQTHANALIVGEPVKDGLIRVDLPKLHTPYQTG